MHKHQLSSQNEVWVKFKQCFSYILGFFAKGSFHTQLITEVYMKHNI